MKKQRSKTPSIQKLAMSEEQATATTEPATAAAAAATTKEEEETKTTEEKPECGFCIFMKAGGCAEAFEAWSRCVDSAREAEKAGEEEATEKGGDDDGAGAGAAAASSPSEEKTADSSSSTPDFATRCREATMALQRCMEEHRDYYRDFLADADEAVAGKMEGGEGDKEEEEAEKKKE